MFFMKHPDHTSELFITYDVTFKKIEDINYHDMPYSNNEIYWKFDYKVKAVCWLDVEFEKEKFCPGPGLEPGSLAFRANALTNWAIQDKYQSMIELIS